MQQGEVAKNLFFQTKMDKILDRIDQLSEEEWKQVQQLMNNKKPFVLLTKATVDDCIRPDGLDLNIDYATICVPTLHIPDEFAAPTARAHL